MPILCPALALRDRRHARPGTVLARLHRAAMLSPGRHTSGYCSAPESIDCPGYRTWLETCQQALAAYPNDPRVKLAADARALSSGRQSWATTLRLVAWNDAGPSSHSPREAGIHV